TFCASKQWWESARHAEHHVHHTVPQLGETVGCLVFPHGRHSEPPGRWTVGPWALHRAPRWELEVCPCPHHEQRPGSMYTCAPFVTSWTMGYPGARDATSRTTRGAMCEPKTLASTHLASLLSHRGRNLWP